MQGAYQNDFRYNWTLWCSEAPHILFPDAWVLDYTNDGICGGSFFPFIVVFFCQSIGHLLFSTILSAYIVFAVAHFEEPDLVKSIGPDYVDYMKTTPRYIPNFTRLFTRTPSKKAD